MKGWRSRKTETKLKRSVWSGARCDKRTWESDGNRETRVFCCGCGCYLGSNSWTWIKSLPKLSIHCTLHSRFSPDSSTAPSTPETSPASEFDTWSSALETLTPFSAWDKNEEDCFRLLFLGSLTVGTWLWPLTPEGGSTDAAAAAAATGEGITGEESGTCDEGTV